MPFEIGNNYSTGRPKGSKNKISFKVQSILKSYCEVYFNPVHLNPCDDNLIDYNFLYDIKYLTPKERAFFMLNLLKVLPSDEEITEVEVQSKEPELERLYL